jgi:hypothetical protein
VRGAYLWDASDDLRVDRAAAGAGPGGRGPASPAFPGKASGKAKSDYRRDYGGNPQGGAASPGIVCLGDSATTVRSRMTFRLNFPDTGGKQLADALSSAQVIVAGSPI